MSVILKKATVPMPRTVNGHEVVFGMWTPTYHACDGAWIVITDHTDDYSVEMIDSHYGVPVTSYKHFPRDLAIELAQAIHKIWTED